MFLFVVLLCCVLHPILHYYCVFGKRESLQRFLVEDGVKPAIFGSYSYDPVRQVFVPPPSDPNAANDTTNGLLDSPTDRLADSQAHKQADQQAGQQGDPQTDLPTGTQSDVNGKTLPHQPTSTPSVTMPDQSLQDSFISTAGWTVRARGGKGKQAFRKNVEPINNRPWWQGPKNVTFNII